LERKHNELRNIWSQEWYVDSRFLTAGGETVVLNVTEDGEFFTTESIENGEEVEIDGVQEAVCIETPSEGVIDDENLLGSMGITIEESLEVEDPSGIHLLPSHHQHEEELVILQVNSKGEFILTLASNGAEIGGIDTDT